MNDDRPMSPAAPPAPALEGGERPPPGTRTMAVVRWALVGLVGLAAAGAWVEFARTASARPGAAGMQYLCPMHPHVVADHPGECPICGMDLVPARGGEKPAAGPLTAAAGTPVAGRQRYTCPMHPEFVTADARARCPKCGMKLVPLPAAGAAPHQP